MNCKALFFKLIRLDKIWSCSMKLSFHKQKKYIIFVYINYEIFLNKNQTDSLGLSGSNVTGA